MKQKHGRMNRGIGEAVKRGFVSPFLRFSASPLLLLILLIASPALAVKTEKTWEVSLETSSGVTDPGITPGNVVTGVSDPAIPTGVPCILDGESGVTLIDLTRYDYDLLTFEIQTANVLASVTPAYTDNTATFSVYWREALTAEGVAKADLVPVLSGVSLNAGSTPWQVHVPLGRGKYGGLEFRSACTSWQNFTAKAQFSNAPAGVYIPVRVIQEGSFAMAANGVSKFEVGSIGAWPGGEYLEAQAGNTIYVTGNGSVPTATGNGEKVIGGVKLSLEGHEARSAQILSSAAQTVWYRILSRKRQ